MSETNDQIIRCPVCDLPVENELDQQKHITRHDREAEEVLSRIEPLEERYE